MGIFANMLKMFAIAKTEVYTRVNQKKDMKKDHVQS